MAPQDAINNLKKYENCLAFTSEEIESIKLAIEALEKQIPKKPQIVCEGDAPDGIFVRDEWICPNCGLYNVDYDKDECCPKCGQKIDWSE